MSAALPWKPVDTAHLADPNSSNSNHYDEDGISSSKELEASPQESVAMFVGLEVISGNDYTVNQYGELQPVEKKSNVGEKEEKASTRNKEAREGTFNDHDYEPSSTDQASSKNKKRKAKSQELVEGATDNEETAKDDKNKSKKKRKKKKKKKRKNNEHEEDVSAQARHTDEQAHVAVEPLNRVNSDTADSVERLQTSWMIATGGVQLHTTLCTSLLEQDFWTPTPIQSATLAAALLGKRNIVGAAPTGSGKTLSYLLPILDTLLQQEQNRVLTALILTPTRELALQVTRECEKLVSSTNSKKYWCASIVGGLALQKQQRVLIKNKPPILVATPGRLWELVSFMYIHGCVVFGSLG